MNNMFVNNFKKITVIIMVVVVTVSLAACGGSGDLESDPSLTGSASGQIERLTGGSAGSDQSREGAGSSSGKSEETSNNTRGSTSGNSSDSSNSSSGESQGASKGSSSGSSSSSSSKSLSKNICYVTVEGYCQDKEIKIKSTDTAYSVLKKTGATVNARKTQYGIYVAGINGLNEFDKGADSGWMYSVNGTPPNDSAGDVKVHKGDKIKWYYVTEY